MAFERKKVTLGSGDIHIETIVDDNVPENFDEFYASKDNIIGEVKGGAEVEYAVERFEDESDLGRVKVNEITAEDVHLRSGLMTWNGDTLERICETAEQTVDEETGIITIKIGGLSKKKDQRYLIGFEHYSKKLRVTIVGHNIEGFTLSFKQDAVTVVDVDFFAESMDGEGTLLIINDLRYMKDTGTETAQARSAAKTAANTNKESLL